MKYYQKDSILDFFFPARCPVCGQFVPDIKKRRRSKRNGASLFCSSIKSDLNALIHIPATYELICKPCFFQLPFVLEPYCMICGRPLENPLSERCDDCRRYQHAFSEARAVFSYKGVAQKSLYQLKYGGCKEYSRFFAASMAQYLSTWIHTRGITAIVPVPLHPSRQRKRTYNQAEEIAVRLGEHLDLPVYSDLLIRQKQTIAQKDLNRQERMKNLADAFCINHKWIRKKMNINNECLLLLDDIYTTGATADSAAAVLRAAGCKAVFVGAVAVTG